MIEEAEGNTGCGDFVGVMRSVLQTRSAKNFARISQKKVAHIVCVGRGEPGLRHLFWAPTTRDRVPWYLSRLELGLWQSLPHHWSRHYQLNILGTCFFENFLPAGVGPFYTFTTTTLVWLWFPLSATLLWYPGEQAEQWNSTSGKVGRRVPLWDITGQQHALLPRPAGEAE